MGIFGTKKEETTEAKSDATKEAVAVAKKTVSTAKASDRDLAGVLKKPRVSEKAYYATERGVYVFEIHADATKHDVRDAIKAKYNVSPKKVNIVKQAARRSMSERRGRTATVSGLKKAYVYLKAGDKIDLV